MAEIWRVTVKGKRGKRKADEQHRSHAHSKRFAEDTICRVVVKREEIGHGKKLAVQPYYAGGRIDYLPEKRIEPAQGIFG